MRHNSNRPTYQPSFRCDLARFPRALALLAAASAGIAAIDCGQIFISFYLSAMSVFLPVLLVASAAQAAVRRGHWRNPVLAGGLGAVCGLAGYLGYFHADQCLRWGVPWTAVDRMPGYVAFRMETDHWQRMSKGALLRPQQPAPGFKPNRPVAKANFRSWNWAGFAFEALALALVPLATGVVSARTPYSEQRQRWCSREQLTLAPNDVVALKKALAEGTVGQWVDSRPRKVGAHLPHGKVLAWYIPAERGKEPDPDVYLTIGSARPVLLLPEEAAAFVTLLPGLQDLAGSTLRQLADEAEQANDPTSARVWPVSPPYAGQSESPANRRRYRLIVRSLRLLPVAPALLLPGGCWLLWRFAVSNQLLPNWVLAAYVLGVGLPSVVLLRWWYRPGEELPFRAGVRFGFHQLRQALAVRPQPLVAPDDPRAVYCEMLPRRIWGTGKPKPGEYNNGLLLVDAGQKALVFEGDFDCYWIPAAAVLACDVELHPRSTSTTAGLWAVVLRVRLGSGTWEFPFFPFANIEGRNRWERAMNLYRQIEVLCGRSFAGKTAAPPPKPAHSVVG
jgi:hypothetical protein